jgi:hypothetical protein
MREGYSRQLQCRFQAGTELDHASWVVGDIVVLIHVLPAGALAGLLRQGLKLLFRPLASLSLASYRELGGALHDQLYHPLLWFKINTGDGSLWVALACLIGIVAPALWGRWIWLYSIANFDRLVGRPWRAEPSQTESLAAQPALAT